jgi:endogenous inhibitor of DNA gyrase (YacG/DUF329 family)
MNCPICKLPMNEIIQEIYNGEFFPFPDFESYHKCDKCNKIVSMEEENEMSKM